MFIPQAKLAVYTQTAEEGNLKNALKYINQAIY